MRWWMWVGGYILVFLVCVFLTGVGSGDSEHPEKADIAGEMVLISFIWPFALIVLLPLGVQELGLWYGRRRVASRRAQIAATETADRLLREEGVLTE